MGAASASHPGTAEPGGQDSRPLNPGARRSSLGLALEEATVPDLAQLYEEDFVRWTEVQAKALRDAARAGANLPLDWENLAEEVGDLGISQRNALRSRIATIIEHLMKLELSPAQEPRRGWAETVVRTRLRIERLLKDSPSLRREVPQIIADETVQVVKLVAFNLTAYGEATPPLLAKLGSLSYAEEQVLGDWLPAEAGISAA